MMIEQIDATPQQVGGWSVPGSLPPGLPADSWATLLQVGHDHGLVTLLDSSGIGLQKGIEGRPHILKINGRELTELGGKPR